MTTIALEGLGFRRGATSVLRDLDLRIEPGQIVSLVGPSGSGKTTLLELILGLRTPHAGSVRLDDEVVSREGKLLVPPEDRGLSMVFQDLALWPHLTVRANLAFGMRGRVTRAEQDARIDALLARLGLGDKAERYPGALSGGEAQRVAIGRALVVDPRGILLDEPLANLDVPLKRELLLLLRSLFDERPRPVLFVSHDLKEAAVMGGRVVVLEGGRIVQEATLAELRARPGTAFVRALVEDLGTREPHDG